VLPDDLHPDGPAFRSTSAPEEQLAGPSRWRGRWVVLAALVAGAAIWALLRPAQPPPPNSQHPVRPAPIASRLADPACRGLAGCSVRADVPPAIARLARAYLPSGADLRVRTVVAPSSPSGFVARYIEAHVDSATVLIRVQRGGSRTRAIAPDPLGVGSLLLHRLNAGFVVRLQYLAPDTVPPMVSRLQALMRDPRLTSS